MSTPATCMPTQRRSRALMTDLAPLPPTAAEAEWWGVAEAASHCGILPGTWRDYVARGRAPQPDDPDEGAPKQRRRPRWRAETVTAWQASRVTAWRDQWARHEEATR
jgi:hypothetical protein